MTSPEPDLASLWAAARAMFVAMIGATAEPAELFKLSRLSRRETKLIRGWLNPLLAMVRKLVLIEAAALLRQPAPAAKPARPTQRAEPKAKAGAKPRPPSLRLWPGPERMPVRIRLLGPPTSVREIWRENRRMALTNRLKKARYNRPPVPVLLARRMQALARVLYKPRNAARRLAKRLRAAPRLALKLIARRLPRARRYDIPEYRAVQTMSFNAGVRIAYPNTS